MKIKLKINKDLLDKIGKSFLLIADGIDLSPSWIRLYIFYNFFINNQEDKKNLLKKKWVELNSR
jgi:hypothetical protein